MNLTYEEKKSIVLEKIDEMIKDEMENPYKSNYKPPEIVFSTTQGSIYLDSSHESAVKAKNTKDLKGRSLRFKHIKDNVVDYGYIDITTFISKEDADEILRWLNEDIGKFDKIVGKEFDPQNTTKTVNVSFVPKEGLVPFEWVAWQDKSSNIKVEIDSKNHENSKVTLNPVYSKFVNGEIVSEHISSNYLPGFHIGHPIKEVFKEKNYFFDAAMFQTLSEKEFSKGEHYNTKRNNIESFTYPKEDFKRYKELKEEEAQLNKLRESLSKEDYYEQRKRIRNEIQKYDIKEFPVMCPKGISQNIVTKEIEKSISYDDIEL